LRLDRESASKSYTFRLTYPAFDYVAVTTGGGLATMSPLSAPHSSGCLCKSSHSSAAVDDYFFVGLAANYSLGLSFAFLLKLVRYYYYLIEATAANLVLAHPSFNDYSLTASCCQLGDFIVSDSSALQQWV